PGWHPADAAERLRGCAKLPGGRVKDPSGRHPFIESASRHIRGTETTIKSVRSDSGPRFTEASIGASPEFSWTMASGESPSGTGSGGVSERQERGSEMDRCGPGSGADRGVVGKY